VGYSDAYWIGNFDRKFTIGFCTFGENLVTWKNKKVECGGSFKCRGRILSYNIHCKRTDMNQAIIHRHWHACSLTNEDVL
jgi:hypothetical protein